MPQKKENFSEIFMIDYEIIQMPNPKEEELDDLVILKNNLQVSKQLIFCSMKIKVTELL